MLTTQTHTHNQWRRNPKGCGLNFSSLSALSWFILKSQTETGLLCAQKTEADTKQITDLVDTWTKTHTGDYWVQDEDTVPCSHNTFETVLPMRGTFGSSVYLLINQNFLKMTSTSSHKNQIWVSLFCLFVPFRTHCIKSWWEITS